MGVASAVSNFRPSQLVSHKRAAKLLIDDFSQFSRLLMPVPPAEATCFPYADQSGIEQVG
jgi:hypothetical protein